jgi:hypothetical protein
MDEVGTLTSRQPPEVVPPLADSGEPWRLFPDRPLALLNLAQVVWVGLGLLALQRQVLVFPQTAFWVWLGLSVLLCVGAWVRGAHQRKRPPLQAPDRAASHRQVWSGVGALAAWVLSAMLLDWVWLGKSGDLALLGAMGLATQLLLFCIAVFLIEHVLRPRQPQPWRLIAQVPWVLALHQLIWCWLIKKLEQADDWSAAVDMAYWGVNGAVLTIMGVVLLRRFQGQSVGILLAALVLVSLIWLPARQIRDEAGSVFVPSENTQQDAAQDNNFEQYRALYQSLDVESLYYRQPELVQGQLARLQPQQPGQLDLYFLGFAGDASQNVFMQETFYARQLFDRRFGTQGRSQLLINHVNTTTALPLANTHNLKMVLKGIAQQMDPEEDMLFLFITSHGSETHFLAVDFWPLRMNDINPETLRQALDEAAIRWRLLMISACYSGGFIEPLKTPTTLIATAAAADRSSFGCSNENQFTWFGKAVLEEQLEQTRSFTEAFERARQRIAGWEAEKELASSNPQLWVGEAMAQKLPLLQRTLE